MIITNFYPVLSNKYTNTRCNPALQAPSHSPAIKSGMCTDTFVKSPSFTAKPLTVSWYKNLTPEKKELLNKYADNHIYHNKEWLFYDKNFNKAQHYHEIITTGIKDKLNDRFGEGNYVVIPIGRSLSSVGKCLGYKIGEENVKQLPMSSAGRFMYLEDCKEDFSLFNKYINSIGLSKEDVKKLGKHYVFIDFVNSGRSLKGARHLFESDKVWGEHFDNVHFENVLKLLPEVPTELVKEDLFFGDTFAKDFKSMLMNGQFKKYSAVKDCPRFTYLEDAVIEPENYDTDRMVFYWKFLDGELGKRA